MKRIKAAFRTNEPQVTSVVMFTFVNVFALAISKSETKHYSAWLLALLMWPVLAFVFNLIDPIPEQKEGDE